MAGQKLGDAGVASICEVGGFPGIRVGLGKGRGVTITNIVNGVNPWEVGIKGGTIVDGGSRGGGLALVPRSRGGRELGCWGVVGGGSAYPM